MKEFEFIDKLRLRFNPGSVPGGIGDDCAVIEGPCGKDYVVSTDMLMEGVHFRTSRCSSRDIGWKAAASNWSDIAAMGGTPTGYFLSVALPSELSEDWVDGFIDGMSSVCGAPLLGGDTIRSSGGLCVNITVIGELPHGKAVLRSGARIGDIIYVSGPLGDSAAALRMLEAGEDVPQKYRRLLDRHLRPEPRLREGLALASTEGVHSMMDISDGIGSDIRRMLQASRVGASVDVDSIPVSPELARLCAERGWELEDFSISGGEDYELLFTADPDCRIGIECHAIGRIIEGEGLHWNGGSKDYKGFEHF